MVEGNERENGKSRAVKKRSRKTTENSTEEGGTRWSDGQESNNNDKSDKIIVEWKT